MSSTTVRYASESSEANGEDDPLMLRMADNNRQRFSKREITFWTGAKEIVLNGPINVLLVFVPCALVSNATNMPEGLTFTLSLLGLAPMAERLGFVTEQLALHTNESIGGLLNATFGNATELIVAATALFKGLYRLVQLSMLGSILSNMLLVLGSAFFLGGNRYKTQTFSKISSQMNTTLLILSCLAVLGPTILTLSGNESRLGELGFSRITSIMLLLMYFAFLFFQLYSHKELYESGAQTMYSPTKPKKPPRNTRKKALPPATVSYEHLPSSVLDAEPLELMTPSGLHKRENATSSANLAAGAVPGAASGSGPGLVPMQLDFGEDDNSSNRKPPSSVQYKIFRRCCVCTCLCNGCCTVTASKEGKEGKDDKKDSTGDLSYLQQSDSDDHVDATTGMPRPQGVEAHSNSTDAGEEDLLGFNYALLWMGVLTVFITILSDAISSSIEEAAEDINMSGVFLAAIVLPIVGNAAEHASAISFAMRNKMDISLAVAVGSSTQIALCVLPLLVIMGWCADLDMSLNFGAYESSTLLLCVIGVTFAIKDGTSNWLLGLSMIVAYCIIAIGFYAHRNDSLK